MRRRGILGSLIRLLLELVYNHPAALKSITQSGFTEAPARSLNGCDRLLLPQITRDFPDFDPNQVKILCRQFLRERYGSDKGFTVHKVVISQYLRHGAQKTVVLQAAFSTGSGTKLRQRRAHLHYTYLLPGSSAIVAANCPNCGGALGYGVTVCPYCDSRVATPMGSTWQFTELTED